MTIHVFEGEKASHTHENQMLQVFLEQLENRWSQSADWIYVIVNAMWEGREIDLVCVLPSMILVGDFKDYRGTIAGTENGPWRVDGITVRGGAQSNPFVQLRHNRFAVMNWLKDHANPQERNLGHIAAGVVFSGPITDELTLSEPVRRWFHVTDLASCARTLDTLASPQLELQKNEAERIVAALGVTEYRWHSSRPSIQEIGGDAPERTQPPLTEHQQEAMAVVRNFLQSAEHKTMAVLGMTSTGKTRLLVEAREAVASMGLTPVVLMPNSRLAARARSDDKIDCDSIYYHLYLSETTKDPAEADEDGAETIRQKEKKTPAGTIPLKDCNDPRDCVYLIDEAQLLGNDLFRTADGKQYGSGQLLSDLFTFSGIGASQQEITGMETSQRKIIFFGDPYQLQRASQVDRVLDGAFQSARSIGHQSVALEQQILEGQGDARLSNARKLVEALRAGRFASLAFEEGASFRVIDSKLAAQELLERFQIEPYATWCLADTHAKVERFVRWLRPRLFETKRLQAMEQGELLELVSVNYPSDDLPFQKRSIEGGKRYQLVNAHPAMEIRQELKGRDQPIRFHVVPRASLDRPGVSPESGGNEVANFLLDYLLAKKPEFSAEVAIAVRVWARPPKRPVGDKEDEREVEQTDAFSAQEHRDDEVGLPGVTLARYGYATTVHHAQGMSQPLCYVNADTEQGRHSEGYFRWLYTALTVAKGTLSLFNFQPLHPFDSVDWNPKSAQESADIPVGAGWSFDPDAAVSDRDQARDVPEGLADSRNVKASVALWLRLSGAVQKNGWQVARVASSPYREKYELVGPDGEASLVVTYDGKHRVKVLRMDESHWDLLCGIASACLADNDFSQEGRGMLQALQQHMHAAGWRVVSAAETNWRLLVSLARAAQERVQLEVNFGKHGLATSLRPLQYSQPGLLEEIRETLA